MSTNDEIPTNLDEPESYADRKGSLWDLVRICKQIQSGDNDQDISWIIFVSLF